MAITREKVADVRFRRAVHVFSSRVQPSPVHRRGCIQHGKEGEREGGRGGGDGGGSSTCSTRDATCTMHRDASAKRIGLVTSSFRKWSLPSLPAATTVRLSGERSRRDAARKN